MAVQLYHRSYLFVALLMSGAIACKSSVAPADSGALASSQGVSATRDGDSGLKAAADASATASSNDAATLVDDETAVPMTSEELVTRSKHLVEAVAGDNPELAIDFLLSKDAYAQFYAEKDATRAWERHVKRAFQRAIRKLHRRRNSETAKFTRFELGTRLVKSSVGRGKSKRHVWHSRGSRIYYSIDGRELHISIREMIAWRGAWYIARLR